MLLWKDLVSNLAPYAGDGSCDPAYVAKELNKAIRRLMCSKQWKSLSSTMRMAVVNSVFPMPYNVETMLGCAIDGHPGQIYGTEYQVVPGGPGDLDAWSTTYTPGRTGGLHDMGEFGTMFDVPLDREGYVIVAFCTAVADVGKIIKVQGLGLSNEEIREDLPLVRWDGGVEGQASGNWGSKTTVKPFRNVARVILPDPAPAGYISLYAVYPSENQMYFLAKLHPSLRIPQFRRYRFTTDLNGGSTSLVSPGLASYGVCATVLARVKLRFVPYVDDYDVVPFDSEEAIQYMMVAANQEKLNPQAGAQYEQLALRLLGDAEASKETYHGMPIIISSNPVTSLGNAGHRCGMLGFGPGYYGGN